MARRQRLFLLNVEGDGSSDNEAEQESAAANGPITIDGVAGSFDNIDAAIAAATKDNYTIKIDESATE